MVPFVSTTNGISAQLGCADTQAVSAVEILGGQRLLGEQHRTRRDIEVSEQRRLIVADRRNDRVSVEQVGRNCRIAATRREN
ncbi:hypothetical protein [Sphingomonas sp. LR55]|uniref:hypothetical protein n=1 Tax=Sphingomonas sp. LR55 TaxID=3050231 RepID=UPI002FE2A76C